MSMGSLVGVGRKLSIKPSLQSSRIANPRNFLFVFTANLLLAVKLFYYD